jgi:hypothetical protein
MYGSNFTDLPTLRNYAQAAKWEEAVTPIRGRTPECKPLGKRKNTHANIRKEEDKVICKLYHTDVLTYHKDGRIEVHMDGWASQTTMAFIESLLDVRLVRRHNRIWMRSHTEGTSALAWNAMHSTDVNLLTRRADGYVLLHTPVRVYIHKVNRVATNNVRKQYKAFKDYLVRTMRLRDAGFSGQEFGDVFGWQRGANGELPNFPSNLSVYAHATTKDEVYVEFLALAKSDDSADHYKASLCLAWSTASFRRDGAMIPRVQNMLKALDDCILKVHRNECFTETPSTSGDPVRDPYAKFFGRG